MQIQVNDATRETAATRIDALVAELGFAPGTVLVEHNGTALRPDEWRGAALQENDRVELLRIVAGG
jgi:thiamine biosynthesis protein ThiS